MCKKKVLILGCTGMLGHTIFTKLLSLNTLDVYATARSLDGYVGLFSPDYIHRIFVNVDADNFDTIYKTIVTLKPDIVINCIGLIKQKPAANDPIRAITINSLLPHKLSVVCHDVSARLIHMSTDCVFDGTKGSYTEDDPSTATDLYGKTKFLGELHHSHCVTLRTSIIGHELIGKYGLIEWFLKQQKNVHGYTNAIYSGFSTIEMARIIYEFVIPNSALGGLYHVSAAPISKFDLLKLVADKYEKKIHIEPFSNFYCNRSLDSSLFQRVTGYIPPTWPNLIETMYQNYISSPYYENIT